MKIEYSMLFELSVSSCIRLLMAISQRNETERPQIKETMFIINKVFTIQEHYMFQKKYHHSRECKLNRCKCMVCVTDKREACLTVLTF